MRRDLAGRAALPRPPDGTAEPDVRVAGRAILLHAATTSAAAARGPSRCAGRGPRAVHVGAPGDLDGGQKRERPRHARATRLLLHSRPRALLEVPERGRVPDLGRRADGQRGELAAQGPEAELLLPRPEADRSRRAQSRKRVYPGCSQRAGSKERTLGTSVGWSDIYPSSYYQNWVNVRGLTRLLRVRDDRRPAEPPVRERRGQQQGSTRVRLPASPKGEVQEPLTPGAHDEPQDSFLDLLAVGVLAGSVSRRSLQVARDGVPTWYRSKTRGSM